MKYTIGVTVNYSDGIESVRRHECDDLKNLGVYLEAVAHHFRDHDRAHPDGDTKVSSLLVTIVPKKDAEPEPEQPLSAERKGYV